MIDRINNFRRGHQSIISLIRPLRPIWRAARPALRGSLLAGFPVRCRVPVVGLRCRAAVVPMRPPAMTQSVFPWCFSGAWSLALGCFPIPQSPPINLPNSTLELETSAKDVASGLCPDKLARKSCISGHRPDTTSFVIGLLQRFPKAFGHSLSVSVALYPALDVPLQLDVASSHRERVQLIIGRRRPSTCIKNLSRFKSI